MKNLYIDIAQFAFQLQHLSISPKCTLCLLNRVCVCLGVSYFIDMVRGNCSVSIINPDGFDAVRTTSGLVRMRSPEEFFFGGETDYSYEGIVGDIL